MIDLGVILDRYGARFFAVAAIVGAAIWGLVHFTAAPGGQVSVLFGLVSYTKSGVEDHGRRVTTEQQSSSSVEQSGSSLEQKGESPPAQLKQLVDSSTGGEPIPDTEHELASASRPQAMADDSESSLSAAREKRIPAQESLGYEFRLLGCSKSGEIISCQLAVKNLRGDRNLFIKKRSSGRARGEWRSFKGVSMIDGGGSEFFARSISLASIRSESEQHVGPEAILISGLETPISLIFNEIPAKTERIARLFLNGWDWDSEAQVEVVFKNVALEPSA